MAILEKPSKITQTFVALLIDLQSVQAGIWQVDEGKTKVVAVGERQTWNGKDLDELLDSVDFSLSAAVAKITEAGLDEPQKAIFGLPLSWTKKGKIAADKSEWLKKIASKLALKPVGFVITTEALAHFLKVKEGAPVSAILIGLEEEEIEINLLVLGETIGMEEVVRSENLALDVEEGLLRLPRQDSLPPRMILYGEGDLEEARQKLVAYPWQEPGKKLNFLHFPRIELGDQNFVIYALCLAGGTEIAESKELIFAGEEKEDKRQKDKVKIEEGIKEKEPAVLTEEVAEKEAPGQPDEEDQVADLGFVVGRDVLAAGEVRETEDAKDAEDKEKMALLARPPIKEAKVTGAEGVDKVEPAERTKRKGGIMARISPVGAILGKISQLILKLPRLKRPEFAFAPPKLALAGLGAALIAGAFWFYQAVPKAEIVLSVTPEQINQEYELILDPKALASDPAKMILPAKVIETTLSESKTRTTTGRKTVGEQAKGETTIYNRTDARKVFESGLVLIGPGGLEFSLDDEVAVASKTPDLASGVDKWGEGKVGVTAADIGTEYNLAADSQLAFEDYSTSLFLVKNESAFTGGTSRQIQAVSEEDREALKTDLEQELMEKAKQQFFSDIIPGQKLVEESLQVKTAAVDYNRKVGEEAQEISLTLSVKASGLVFEEIVAEDMLRSSLKDQIGDGEFRWEESQLGFEVFEVKEDGTAEARVELTGKIYPSLIAREIAQDLVGKSFDFQKNYLNSLPKVTSFETKITPSFFVRLGRLPARWQNIKVEIKGE